MITRWKILVPSLFLLTTILLLIWHFQNSFGSNTTISHFTQPSADSLQGYYQKSQELQAQQTQSQTINFLATGDIMLSRNVALLIKNNPITHGKYSIGLPFKNMENELSSTNFNFGNLESPFAPGSAAIIGGNSLIFGAPSNFIAGLQDFNFKVLNLANNHAFDQGLEGLLYTKKILTEGGIANEGTGQNSDQAWAPAVVASGGMKICFVGASYSSQNDGGLQKNNYVARIEDLDHLKSAITTAKTECDYIVATMHAGTEYTRTPNNAQIKFAHSAIDYGADVVIGAHPHWIQTIEKYNDKYIFYSLGNFIFDQNWSQATKEGLTLKITLSKFGASSSQAASLDDLQGGRTGAKLQSIELLPVIIENSQPRPATADETKKILDKIGQTNSLLK